MTPPSTYDLGLIHAASLTLGALAGGATGLVHFGLLDWVVRCFASGRALRAAALQLARFAVLSSALYGLSRLGAGPLSAGLVGLMLARQVLLHRIAGEL